MDRQQSIGVLGGCFCDPPGRKSHARRLPVRRGGVLVKLFLGLLLCGPACGQITIRLSNMICTGGTCYITGNFSPTADNTMYMGAGNAGWKQTFFHIANTEQVNFCVPSTSFNILDCSYINSGSVGDLTFWQPESTTRATEYVQFLADTFTGQHYAQFNLDVIPYSNLTFQLGTDILIWSHAYIANLLNTTANMSIDGVAYVWPSSNVTGALMNDGLGNLSWTASGSGGCPAGANTTVQYNNGSGSCAGSSDLTWDYTNGLLTVLPINAASPGIKISQANTNATGELLQILDHSGTTVFEINGSGASLLPNYLIVNGIDPFTDDTANLGAGNAAWKQAFSYDNFQQTSQICTPGSSFTTSDCTYWRSNAAGTVDLMAPGGTLQMAEFLYNSGTGQKYAQFQGAVIPYTNNTFDLGTNSLVWDHAYVANLLNTTANMSIDGVAYTWPSANAAGFLYNNGVGVLQWNPSSSTGVSQLNGLTGALNIVGTANEITVAAGGTSITLSTPQAIATSSSPTFSAITATSIITGSSFFATAGSGAIFNSTNFNVQASGSVSAGSGLFTSLQSTGAGTFSGVVTLFDSSSTALQVTGGATFGSGAAGAGAAGFAIGCNAPSVTYSAGGSLSGQTVTRTVRNSAGTGTCTIIYNCGIETGGTC